MSFLRTNILNVDFGSKVTVFEGYLDSLFYPNSVGVVGVNTDLIFLENNNLDLQYFFDNDKAGFDKSEEKIKEGDGGIDYISQAQDCLGISPTGMFNKELEDRLVKKIHKRTFTKEDIKLICMAGGTLARL